VNALKRENAEVIFIAQYKQLRGSNPLSMRALAIWRSLRITNSVLFILTAVN
jgi:hypothetical protein